MLADEVGAGDPVTSGALDLVVPHTAAALVVDETVTARRDGRPARPALVETDRWFHAHLGTGVAPPHETPSDRVARGADVAVVDCAVTGS